MKHCFMYHCTGRNRTSHRILRHHLLLYTPNKIWPPTRRQPIDRRMPSRDPHPNWGHSPLSSCQPSSCLLPVNKTKTINISLFFKYLASPILIFFQTYSITRGGQQNAASIIGIVSVFWHCIWYYARRLPCGTYAHCAVLGGIVWRLMALLLR